MGFGVEVLFDKMANIPENGQDKPRSRDGEDRDKIVIVNVTDLVDEDFHGFHFQVGRFD